MENCRIGRDGLARIKEGLRDPEIAGQIRSANNADLLPYLFRVKGEPFSLKDRQQFEVMFEKTLYPDLIVMSGRQLGKSLTLSRSEVFLPLQIPQIQMLYVAPLQEQARRYSDLYLSEAIRSCPLAQKLQTKKMARMLSDTKILTAVGHQTFGNGSGIQLTYAKTSADRARGITADVIDFDEVQDQSDENVPIISESLTSSKYGCRRFTGTAKTTENYIEAQWQKSSQCEWVMKCGRCGTWAIPSLDGGVLKMIGADGMHCLHCGGRLNVRDGKWVAAFPSRMNSFRGYHIPQVVCPAIVDDANNWQKLLRKLTSGTLATFIQENLGISYSVGQRLLTRQHIMRQCVLPDTKWLQDEIKRNPARYTYIVAGVDWGGAELTSFTVITVVGIRPNGRIDVLWARRYRGYDPDEQLTDIARICRFYNVVTCLDEDTLVLTKTELGSPCYKRIIDVSTLDWVWDGVEWVKHDGVKLMRRVGRKGMEHVGHTRLTGDHKVYLGENESRRADSLSGKGKASAMAWRRATSPISAWHDVWLHAVALGRACARLFRAAFVKKYTSMSVSYATTLRGKGWSLDRMAKWRKKSDVVCYRGKEMPFKDFVRDFTGMSYAYARQMYRQGKSLDEIAGWQRARK